MCGIAGVVALDHQVRLEPELVVAILNGMTYRGPDASRIQQLDGAVLGHLRLAILDTHPRSNQPMSDATGTVWVTYNGEIFNFLELKHELEICGHHFRTKTDTEVLVEAYREWGINCVCRFEGQFAFALYDLEKRRIYLVRDRFGIKPLYYAFIRSTIIFSSELTGIANYPGFERRLNPLAVSSFLSYRYAIGEESYFYGANRVPPATILEIGEGIHRRHCYWQLNLHELPLLGRADLRADYISSLINKSVRQNLIADHPVSLFLSGGLDSSIIALEARRIASCPLLSFTAQLKEDAYNESAYAHEVASALGLSHHLVDLDEHDPIMVAEDLVARRGEPTAMHNEVGMYLLAREAARYSKVVLCGEGADELFAGYSRIYRSLYDYQRAKFAAMLPTQFSNALRARLSIENDAHCLSEVDFFLRRYSYFPILEKLLLFRPEIRVQVDTDAALNVEFAKVFERSSHLQPVNRIMLVFLELHLPGLLAMLDATTMAAGVEARVPFLNHHLVQAAVNLPVEDRLRWRNPLGCAIAAMKPVSSFSERFDETKVILRRAYGSSIPISVLRRKKMGFPMPLGQWLGVERLGQIRERLLSPKARTAELFEPNHLKAWLEKGAACPSDAFGKRLWLLFNLELFLSQW
ncbi:MAG: asparagine synthase (glutamine-hydrolyzing) [Tildeniella nuda ZEHNDER 1965/U140]|jgi:asparagine synthase (glutamine-hydrolysing)|nr:asparagine synthase (glutamine-hydrolyzing) [Tildeniella nuda ZEHNDER 1965/U140]